MKFQLILPVLALSILPACQAPERSNETLEFVTRANPDAKRLMADVEWLADDAREGRRAGTPGEWAAAEWLAERFEELGLEPAGEDGFFQAFPVPLPARDGGRTNVIYEDGVQKIISGAERIVPLFCSGGERTRGKLVFCDYGIVHPDYGWDSYGDIDLDGAIALIVRGTPPAERVETDPEQKSEGWGNSGSIFHKVMTAKRMGASGVLVVLHPDSEGELLGFDAGQAARSGIPCAMISGKAMAEIWSGYGAVVRSIDEMARTSERKTSPRAILAGAEVELRADVIRETATAHNVLAKVPGVFPSRTVVIGAHFDHLGRGGEGSLAPDALGEVHNGADDNASGTACVLELARILSDGFVPDGDVIFALWSGEELGLLGSEYWIKHPTVDLERVQANINMDMVGRMNERTLQVLGAGTSPSFADWMTPAGAAADLELSVNLSGQGMGGSDHQVFLRNEIPALHLFTGVHTDYHRPTDDADTVNPGGMARVVELSLDFVTRMQSLTSLPFTVVEEETRTADRQRSSFRSRFGSIPSYDEDPRGLLLVGTSPGGPAERAGLLGGDVLTGVGEIEITTIHDFVYALQYYKPGDVVRVTFLRDGAEEETQLTLTSSAVE